MPRFYVPNEITGEFVTISDSDQIHHIRNVLRLKPGESITVFDSAGNEYLCTLASADKTSVKLMVLKRNPVSPKAVHISIGCAIPRKGKMDDVIDKLVQLDIDTIIPLETERTIVKLEGDRSFSARRERWEKIARSAAEQSRRSSLPGISPVIKVGDLIRQSSNFDLKLMAAVAADTRNINEVLAGPQPSNVLALIGPEGDFSPQEIQVALDFNFRLVSLGRTVLRVDTAAISLASYLRFTLLS